MLQTLKDEILRLVGSSRGSSSALADTILAQTLQLEQLLKCGLGILGRVRKTRKNLTDK